MKKIKSERGSIVIFVMTSLIFITSFIIATYMNINNRKVESEKELKKIQEEYGESSATFNEMKEEYEKIKNISIVENRELEKSNREYIDKDPVTGKEQRAIIPKGFTIVPGCGHISEGLVITDDLDDNEIDKSNKVARGNQFVWIPVNNMQEFIRQEGISEEKLQDILKMTDEQSLKDNKIVPESQETKNEALAMYNSVKANGGFYIGRYETGTENIIDYENMEIMPDAIVKKGKNVYNNIPWSKSSDSLMNKNGAIEIARNMYINEKYGVRSTLCYGVQWDAVLNFIDNYYITQAKSRPGKWSNSTYLSKSKGNYKETGNWIHQKTGENDLYSIKNIYDLAGNVSEWTMEMYKDDTNQRKNYKRGII